MVLLLPCPRSLEGCFLIFEASAKFLPDVRVENTPAAPAASAAAPAIPIKSGVAAPSVMTVSAPAAARPTPPKTP